MDTATHAAVESRRTEPESTISTTGPRPATPVIPFVSREQLTRRPLRTIDVLIPEEYGGGRIKLRALKQAERERLDDEALEKTYKEDGTIDVRVNNRGFQAKALAMSMCNDDGSPYFPSVEDGMQELGDMDDALFDILFRPCDTLNVLTKEARDALGKGSGESRSNSSSSKKQMNGAASSMS